MMEMKQWIDILELEPHVEGGWFKQTYASDLAHGKRPTATSIYFLLTAENFSALHRLSADEMWYYHDGHPLTIVAIDLKGKLHEMKLGNNLAKGERPQILVPKGWIFGSYVEEGFGMVSCMVTPGFTFEDFELFNRQTLIDQYPNHETLITKMTRE